MVTYDATTEAVRITVRPAYLDDKSDAVGGRFVFAYFVRIENHGVGEVQLLRRHWTIKDATGRVEEVEGDGVVGAQPVIPPDGAHEYQSFSVLTTFEGTMTGTYLMQREDGSRFRARIPEFHLVAMSN
ncbi:Co2+/Mg2+ efflux protein ApaG [Rubrivirga sp.]|uniref:Co2+/Mg2+ efflux protein ApaG n=1 Tax=Rubrivirga sp. TaxID=1885344 RepID=UPI003C76C84D